MNQIVTLNHIHKSFDEKVVLKDSNLELPEKQMTALIGPSGCGKSTLLNIIGLLDNPTSGDVILFNQKNVRLNSRKAMLLLRHKIAYLFQNYALIDNETVSQNLMIALKYVKRTDKVKAIKEALVQVGLAGFEHRKIYSLSGGEQQRVAMARILLKPCDLVLADEPTGNLDDDNKEVVLSILEEMKAMGKTILVVSHDTRVLDRFDKIVQLEL